MVARNFKTSIAMALMYRITTDLLNISVSKFVQTMREFNSHNDSLFIKGIWTVRERGVVWELAATNIAMLPARTIRCHFYGGPPGARNYYTGSLLTMLMDRVMSDSLEDGSGTAMKLFPDSRLTNCGYQV